jgi:hypothetical protein
LVHARGVGSAHAHSACTAHGHAGAACARWADLGQRGPVLLALVPSSSGASTVTAGSETACDEAPHCDSGTLPTRVSGDGTMQVELGRCGGLASGAALVGGGWRRGNTGGGGGAHVAAQAAATGRHGGGGGACAAVRAAATGSTEEAEVLMWRCDSGDALGQRGVASSDRGARTRAGRGGGGAREVGVVGRRAAR